MAKNLVIVESPAKAKTIEGFLGKDYTVKSSLGHVMDLDSKKLSVDIEHDFEPQYQISPDKKKLVSELKKLAKATETVWLASDEDREGEAISWHLYKALKLNETKSKRIVFHEITKTAILHAIENPRQIDQNLVAAQQARRVLDRLVGYELSPLLWRKVKPSLSAGRKISNRFPHSGHWHSSGCPMEKNPSFSPPSMPNVLKLSKRQKILLKNRRMLFLK